jgi:hypothetical protein
MAEIKIAELNIDVNALIKSTTEVKVALDSLREEQKRLQKSGQESSAQFVENASNLKTLSNEYNLGLKAISGHTQAIVDQTNRTQLLEVAMQGEATSIAEARAQNTLLNKLRNETNVTTAEGKLELDSLNKKLDENNAFIKENADQYLKQKINIGNYSDSIKEALSNLNPFNGGIAGFTQRAQEAGGVGNLLKTSLGGVSQGISGVTKASLAFIATPIGAVIALIGIALGALYKYLSSTQKGIDAVTAVTRPLQAIFTALTSIVVGLGEKLVKAFENPKKTLSDLADFVKQNLINRFTAFSKVLEGIIELDFKKVTNGVLQAGTGVENLTDKIANGAKETSKFISNAVEKGKEIDQLNKEIAKGQLEYNRQQIKTNDLIDEQLLISKDTSKSFAERGQAANEIIRLTQELGDKEEAIIQKKIKSLQLEYDLKGVKNLTNEETQAMIDLETQLDEAQDRGLNARLEQTRVLSGLKKEEQDQAKQAEEESKARRQKALDDAFEKSQLELDLFKANQGFKEKALEQNLQNAEKTYDKQLEINQKEFNASEKSENDKLALQLANQEARNALLSEQAKLVIENSRNELDNFILNNQSKLNAEVAFNDSSVANEKSRLEDISKERKEFEELQLQQGLIDQSTYNTAINAVNLENKLQLDALNQEYALQKLEKEAIDFENKLATNETDFSLLAEQLERKRAEEVRVAEKTGADIALINQKYAIQKESLQKQKDILQISRTQETVGQVGAILGAFGVKNKNLSVALAFADAFLGANKAYLTQLIPGDPSSLPRAIFAGATTLATGVANATKIGQVDTKFAGGGFVDVEGNSHAMGGVPIYAGSKYIGEAQGQEGIAIMNRGAFSAFRNFNNAYGDGDVSSNGFYAGGGIITQAVSRESLNVNDVLDATLKAFASIPAPIVLVEDINSGQNNLAQVQNGANF